MEEIYPPMQAYFLSKYSCTGVVDFQQPILDEYLNDSCNPYSASW